MPEIFIIDDDADLLRVLKSWFEKKGYSISTFENSNHLLENIVSVKPAIILLDINLRGVDGRHVCQNLKEQLPFPIKIILFSANPSALLNYQDHFADAILNKPFRFEELEKKFKQQLANKYY